MQESFVVLLCCNLFASVLSVVDCGAWAEYCFDYTADSEAS